MTKFENYLIEQGFEKFQMNCKTMKLEKAGKNHVISTMENLDYRYIKNDLTIVFGLSQKDKPTTLIYPRPNLKFNSFVNDDQMNRILWKYKPEEILDSIINGTSLKL